MSEQDTTYPVNRTALIPATYVDEKGVQHGDDWPLKTTQQVQGVASDGSNVFIGSTSTQDGPNVAPRVTGSSIAVERAGVRYSVDLNSDGSVSGTGSAKGVRLSGTEVLNLAQYFDNITDTDSVTQGTLDKALAQFQRSSGLERK